MCGNRERHGRRTVTRARKEYKCVVESDHTGKETTVIVSAGASADVVFVGHTATKQRRTEVRIRRDPWRSFRHNMARLYLDPW